MSVNSISDLGFAELESGAAECVFWDEIKIKQ